MLLGEGLKELEIPDIIPQETKLISKVEERIVKPAEIEKAEEEIQRAIEGIKHYKRKKSRFKGLFKKKEKPKQKVIEKELPVEFTPRVYEKQDKTYDISDNVHKARSALMEFDLDGAKSIYIEIMRMYNDLSVEDRKKVYQEIKELYDERKNAESLNLK